MLRRYVNSCYVTQYSYLYNGAATAITEENKASSYYCTWLNSARPRPNIFNILLSFAKKYTSIRPRKDSCSPNQIPTSYWLLKLEIIVHNKMDHSVLQRFRHIPSSWAIICQSMLSSPGWGWSETYQAFRAAPQKEKDARTSVKLETACVLVSLSSCSRKRRPSNFAGFGKTFGFWDCASTGTATRFPGGMMPPLGRVKRFLTFRWTVKPSGGCSRETSVKKLSRSGMFLIGSSGCDAIASLISVRREWMYAGWSHSA